MLEAVQTSLQSFIRRLLKFKRRERRQLHRWLEDTRNLLLLSVLVFVPVLMGGLTYLSNTLDLLPFLLFPPLASGAYTLFAEPESSYASPRRFVGGLTLGAVCGWIALELTARFWYHVPPESFHVHPGAAAFGLLLTGLVTWALNLEESQAFSTALLVLVSGGYQFVYVASIFVSSMLVAAAFVLWRENIFERRAELLYGTLQTDDHVLVPVYGDSSIAGNQSNFAAQLASAHEAGKVVLLDLIEGTERTEKPAEDRQGGEDSPDARRVEASLDRRVKQVTDRFEVPCETVVAKGSGHDASTLLQLASEANCDLIVVPYRTDGERISPELSRLFASQHDVIALQATGDRNEWRDVLVPVKRDGEVAHAMLDFAQRLAGSEGTVTACHCISHEGDRPEAESMLVNLVDQFDRAFETRVTAKSVEEFLAGNCDHYDITLIGGSTDRSAASRVLSPPTFKQLEDLDCDFGIVHRG